MTDMELVGAGIIISVCIVFGIFISKYNWIDWFKK